MCLSTVLPFCLLAWLETNPRGPGWLDAMWRVKHLKSVLEILLVMTTGCTNVYWTNPQWTMHLCWSWEWKGTEQLLLNHLCGNYQCITKCILKQLHYQVEQVETKKKGGGGNITSVLWSTVENDPSNDFLPLENWKVLISAIWRISVYCQWCNKIAHVNIRLVHQSCYFTGNPQMR